MSGETQSYSEGVEDPNLGEEDSRLYDRWRACKAQIRTVEAVQSRFGGMLLIETVLAGGLAAPGYIWRDELWLTLWLIVTLAAVITAGCLFFIGGRLWQLSIREDQMYVELYK